MSAHEALEVFSDVEGISAKLGILQDVGLGYLILGQSTATLSGGEAQRLRLAKEILKTGGGRVLYLFDEPTTGLHPHDAGMLLHVFDRFVKRGSSVIVIEHNAEMIAEADWVIELGPEGGVEGGEIIASGTPEEIIKISSSHTGKLMAQLLLKK
jgi:excinuclease ABC subunit A